MATRDRSAAGLSAGSVRPNGRANILGVKSGLEARHPACFEVAAKKIANELGFVFDNVESAVLDPVAEWNRSAHPDALPLRGGDLVADSLARDLPLELGERQEHVRVPDRGSVNPTPLGGWMGALPV